LHFLPGDNFHVVHVFKAGCFQSRIFSKSDIFEAGYFSNLRYFSKSDFFKVAKLPNFYGANFAGTTFVTFMGRGKI